LEIDKEIQGIFKNNKICPLDIEAIPLPPCHLKREVT
jgi:hypothetical protein